MDNDGCVCVGAPDKKKICKIDKFLFYVKRNIIREGGVINGEVDSRTIS
jgi:hypothetical protein